MSNKGTENKRHSITCKEMCVVERRVEGSLGIAFYPIPYDYQVLGRLNEISGMVKDWEARRSKELADELGGLVADLRFEPSPDVSTIASRYRELVWSVYQLTGIDADYFAYYPKWDHNKWRYPSGIQSLSEYSTAIRSFDVSYEVVESCRTRLDGPSFLQLRNEHRLATSLRMRLLPALEEYERGFSAYVSQADKIQPSIFERKSFCRQFSAAHGAAELDFDISPGNQCIVDAVGEYFWATVLEEQYSICRRTEKVVAYSHRRLGWGQSEQKITIEPQCDLYLKQRTNFGYGKSRYFETTLSYNGVSAINASQLIFFRETDKVGFSNYTFNYEAEESSFEASFNDIVRVTADYQRLGEAGFVDKYFRKPLADLSDLLSIVASTDTFLQITTFERLNALTSGPRNPLIPNEGFSDSMFHLNKMEEGVVDDLVATILPIAKAYGPEACVNNARIGQLVDRLISHYVQGSLQMLVKGDLARNRVIRKLSVSLGDTLDVGALARAIIPPVDGAYVKTYEGYELISMRVEKATTVIDLIARLRQIASTTKCESSVASIASTCHTIAEQARTFITESIDPELERIAIEQSRVKQQLDRAAAEVVALKQRGIDTSWIEGQVKPLKVQFQTLASNAAALREKKKELQSYIQSASSI